MAERPIVDLFGLGSAHGADQYGWQIVRAVQDLGLPWLNSELVATPVDLVARLSADRPLVVVDATAHPLPDSPLWRFRWPDLPVDSFEVVSSHAFDLRYALQLAGSLGLLPEFTLIYAVGVSEDVSLEDPARYDKPPAVAIPVLARWLVQDIERCLADPAAVCRGPVRCDDVAGNCAAEQPPGSDTEH